MTNFCLCVAPEHFQVENHREPPSFLFFTCHKQDCLVKHCVMQANAWHETLMHVEPTYERRPFNWIVFSEVLCSVYLRHLQHSLTQVLSLLIWRHFMELMSICHLWYFSHVADPVTDLVYVLLIPPEEECHLLHVKIAVGSLL